MATQSSVTYKEIVRQPELWPAIYDQTVEIEPLLREFFRKNPLVPETEIILTGAGSSAFIGEAIAGLLQVRTGLTCRAVPTTDLVTHASMLIHQKKPTILISFARSGNSPESLAAIDAVNSVNRNVRHLILTCNKDGDLAACHRTEKSSALWILPEESNDKGLAMIGSVSGMILAGLLLGEMIAVTQKTQAKIGINREDVGLASGLTRSMIAKFDPVFKSIGGLSFSRFIALGSGPLLGLAREAHLKVQELSDGQVIGKHDSYLGFRHGPKAALNAQTAMMYFLSPDPFVQRYEQDLINDIAKNQKPMKTILLSCGKAELPADLAIDFPGLEKTELHLLTYLVPAQLLAFYKSVALNLNPDSPSARGAIHRVVQGVTIYQRPHL